MYNKYSMLTEIHRQHLLYLLFIFNFWYMNISVWFENVYRGA
jgi:hypothetical protein